MGRYKNVLVAVDGSQTSKNALKQSLILLPDELTIVTVIPVMAEDYFLSGVEDLSDVLKKNGDKILEGARVIAEAGKVSIKTKLKEGSVYDKIIEAATEENCELIVMGRRGMTRLERVLVGSETSKVIGHFKGKTLVVPRDTLLGLKNILVTTDGSRYSDAAVEEAMDFAQTYNGDLKIVRAVDVNDEFETLAPGTTFKLAAKAEASLEEIKNRAKKAGINTETFVREGDAYMVIVDLAQHLKGDIIFMGSHGRTGLRRILMGSVASRVIGHAPCPVMIIGS